MSRRLYLVGDEHLYDCDGFHAATGRRYLEDSDEGVDIGIGWT